MTENSASGFLDIPTHLKCLQVLFVCLFFPLINSEIKSLTPKASQQKQNK